MVRIIPCLALMVAMVFCSMIHPLSGQDEWPNQLTQQEVRAGWRLLFDGLSSTGWKSATHAGFPSRGWLVKDGTLSVLANCRGGDIVTVEPFSNFELSLEFKLTPGAESGVKYLVPANSTHGPEYQILDDSVHSDAALGVAGNRSLASLYDLIPAENKIVRPVGEWNIARLFVDKNHAEHWLNGVKVVAFDRDTQMFRALVQKSMFKDIENFGLTNQGHILLQDHGDAVSFRNIKIRILRN
ncbi:MAG: 3-keto-disaccharide hydrolase [Candidatus Zhuqueibacterota bacterium]